MSSFFNSKKNPLVFKGVSIFPRFLKTFSAHTVMHAARGKRVCSPLFATTTTTIEHHHVHLLMVHHLNFGHQKNFLSWKFLR